jgi:transposase
MGYHGMTAQELGAIWTRLKARESHRGIAMALGLDKKTVNLYATKITAAGIGPEIPLAEALPILEGLLDSNRKHRPALTALEPHLGDIRGLIQGDRSTGRQPMKAKTAWLVLKELHNLGPRTSYESFKRFCRQEGLSGNAVHPVTRIETEPGKETQIDYAKMGLWNVLDARRTVHAYLGSLSFSRLPYIEFCTSQDQSSFAQAGQRLIHFYGGATERFNLDNLKSGVLDADIYDPVINRAFAELCDHYGIIADPARPAAPKDKGKIERFVQVARELWKRLTALYPNASLDELNAHARTFCREEYGRAIHGTTGVAPMDAFIAIERATLKPLPKEPFEVASWAIAKVARDQFVTVRKTRYGVPAAFIGKELTVRMTGKTIELFHGHIPVRAYVRSSKKEQFLSADFPSYAQPFVPGVLAASLRSRAATMSPQIARYIDRMLTDGSNLACRRATACLALIDKHSDLPGLSHVIAIALAEDIRVPIRLEALLKDESNQTLIPFPVSELGKAMARDASYYLRP